jgi:hypothetical protein
MACGHPPHRLAAFAGLRKMIASIANAGSVSVDLARSDPADHDGGTDHIGGALLASGASGHQSDFPDPMIVRLKTPFSSGTIVTPTEMLSSG